MIWFFDVTKPETEKKVGKIFCVQRKIQNYNQNFKPFSLFLSFLQPIIRFELKVSMKSIEKQVKFAHIFRLEKSLSLFISRYLCVKLIYNFSSLSFMIYNCVWKEFILNIRRSWTNKFFENNMKLVKKISQEGKKSSKANREWRIGKRKNWKFPYWIWMKNEKKNN